MKKRKPMIEYAPCKGCGKPLASMIPRNYRRSVEHLRFWCGDCSSDSQRQEILETQLAQKLQECSR